MLMSKLDEIIYIKDLIPQAWWCNRIGPAALQLRGRPERSVFFIILKERGPLTFNLERLKSYSIVTLLMMPQCARLCMEQSGDHNNKVLALRLIYSALRQDTGLLALP